MRLSMSRRGFGGSSGTYHVRASELEHDKHMKSLPCTVVFLDHTQQLFQIEKRATGQVLMDMVYHHLELVEKDYFGLQFSDNGNGFNIEYMRWLDPLKQVRKQLGRFPYTLYLRVKFYVTDPSKLQEEYTRYHLFLQLRRDILEGRLYVPISVGCLLASYAVQSELGDYCPDEHQGAYITELRLLANQDAEIEKKIAELHKLHKGQTPADAEFHYLDHAKRLEMYGVDLHRARDSTQKEIHLGVTAAGLVVFHNNVRINSFSWSRIVKISFKRKQFFIQLRREQTEDYESALGFNLLSYRSCKNLWKSCVEHHTFFRLHTPKQPRKKFMFSLGSRFRYSGRTEFQTLEETKRITRTDKSFVRISSSRVGRRTVPVAEEKRNGAANGTSHPVRHYESFNNKVQSITRSIARKAWQERIPSDDDGGFLQREAEKDKQAFTPSIVSKIKHYIDDSDSDTRYGSSAGSNGNTDSSETGNLVTIRIHPDESGRFGFNVKGGADQNLPVLVTRVAPNTAADRCYPRLHEGDQVLAINGRDVSNFQHERIVNFIKSSRDSVTGDLVLTVKPNAYIGEDVEEPAFQYVPDTPHVSITTSKSDALLESILLISESLDTGAIIGQFEQLYKRNSSLTANEAKEFHNISKNRYRDISPYDSTRVKLKAGVDGDYINANFVNMNIPGSGIVNRYIAAQGPLPSTSGDFWLMVWESQSPLVVMVTTVVERGRVKCHRYWPDCYETQDFSGIQVTCVKEDETEGFAFREFLLVHVETGEERSVSHMQYLSWPDHGCPDDHTDFLQFINRVRSARCGVVEPIVVHCSAGIGRTGVLITMETAMCQIEANEPIYPLEIVKSMRDQRAMMIQTASQYRFVCEAIVEVYNEKLCQPLPEYKR